MPASRSRPPGSQPPWSDVWTAALTLLVSLLVIAAILSATISLSRSLALRMGMRDDNFVCDMIVASASIIVHLTLEQFLRHTSRSARCLGAYLLFLIRRLFRKP